MRDNCDCLWARGTGEAETLRLVTENSPNGLYGSTGKGKAPGFGVEVLRRVFAPMGQDVSIEAFPVARSWMIVAGGESDGIFSMTRISRQGEQICSFPEESLKQERWVLFIRTADIGKLKFTSFDDLVGDDVAVRGPVPGSIEQPTASPELWEFLREHNNIVETSGPARASACWPPAAASPPPVAKREGAGLNNAAIALSGGANREKIHCSNGLLIGSDWCPL